MWWFLNKFFQKMPKIADYLARIVAYNNSAGWRRFASAHYLKKDYLKNYFVLFWDNKPNNSTMMAMVKTLKTKVRENSKVIFQPI